MCMRFDAGESESEWGPGAQCAREGCGRMQWRKLYEAAIDATADGYKVGLRLTDAGNGYKSRWRFHLRCF